MFILCRHLKIANEDDVFPAVPRSCLDWSRQGAIKDGVYKIMVDSLEIDVFCNGKYTVIQRRTTGALQFDKLDFLLFLCIRRISWLCALCTVVSLK